MDTVERVEIAVVDDNEAVRDALAVLLVLEGYTVGTYAGGQDFLEAGVEFDCLLLDLSMPFGSGQEVLEVLDTRISSTIVMSADEDGPATLAAVNAGAFNFINKPFDADTVLEKVQAILEH